ncbi:MAG: VanZ family protein [Gammaproteobacteria bacterium]
MASFVNPLRHTVYWWLLGFSLVALVIYGSLASGGLIVDVRLWDKLKHLIAYAVLGVYFSSLVTRRALWAVLLIFMIMSIVLEFLQGASGHRQFEVADMVFNGLGLILAALLANLGMRYWCQTIERVLA